MNFEAISASDGKRAIAKAANFLLEKHYLGSNNEKPNLTESDLTNALSAIGIIFLIPRCYSFRYPFLKAYEDNMIQLLLTLVHFW